MYCEDSSGSQSSSDQQQATPSAAVEQQQFEIAVVENWLKSRLSRLIKTCHDGMQNFEPSLATSALHSFFIEDFCDIYLEYAKMFPPNTVWFLHHI